MQLEITFPYRCFDHELQCKQWNDSSRTWLTASSIPYCSICCTVYIWLLVYFFFRLREAHFSFSSLYCVCVCTSIYIYRLCGLVVRVLGYRSGGPGSIPGTNRFSERGGEKKEDSSWSGTGSTQPLSTTEELLDRKVAAPV
jgi:hypothetical protein